MGVVAATQRNHSSFNGSLVIAGIYVVIEDAIA